MAEMFGKASRAFSCLQTAVFQSQQFSVKIKREVYHAVVLPTLLYHHYGVETWTVKADCLKRLKGFHNHCIRAMVGVSRLQERKERTTTRELAEHFGMTESMTDILRWLGHVRSTDGRQSDT